MIMNFYQNEINFKYVLRNSFYEICNKTKKYKKSDIQEFIGGNSK